MKTQYTACLTGFPSSQIECDMSVAGGYIPTQKELATSAAIDAAQSYAEPDAEGWTYDKQLKSTVAIMPDGERRPYTFTASLDGDDWASSFSGTVTINGQQFAVEVW